MNKLSIKPSKPVSAGAGIGLVFMLIFGIGFAAFVGNVLQENDAPPLFSMLFFLVIIIWIGAVVFMLIYHFKNLKSKDGVSLFDISTESDINKEPSNSPMQVLRELETMRIEKLITEEEYNSKRKLLMAKDW
jgi:hypothetical protein